jgi:putative inorganic carbon (HCO3(-)) transporter
MMNPGEALLQDAAPRAGWWRPPAVERPAGSGSAGPFLALVAFTVVLVTAPQHLVPALAPFRPAFVTAVCAAATCLVDHVRRGLRLDFESREVRIAGVLGLWAVATIPFSYWPGGSIAFVLDVYLKTLVVFWILCGTIDDAVRLRRLLVTLSLLTLPLAATGIANFLAGRFAPGSGPEGLKRIAGYAAPLTGNPNDLALLLNLLLPLAAALAASTKRIAMRAALGVIVAADAVAIVLTFSRAGFLTLAVTALWLVRRWTGARRAVLAFAPLLLLAVWLAPRVLPSGYVATLGTIADMHSDSTGSAQERWRDMGAAARFAFGHPLTGAGIGMNTLALNDARGTTWRMVHNVYLEYAVDLGVPGLALFVALLVGCLRCARAARRRAATIEPPSPLLHYATGIEASLVAFAVAGCFHPASYHFYFYYVGALAIATQGIVERTAAGAGA